MIHAFFYNPQANIAASPITDRFSNQDQLGLLAFAAIIPLIEDEWKDEKYAYGEHYDKIDSKLSTHAAKLRQQLLGCRDPCQYQQSEDELAKVEAELCAIALNFDESIEYPL